MEKSFSRMILCIGLLFIFSLTLNAQAVRINDDVGSAIQLYPALAMHPNGPAVVTWMDGREGVLQIYMQMLTRRGMPFLANQRVSNPAQADSSFIPNVAMDANGRFTITWDQIKDELFEAVYQRFYANGVPLSEPAPVSDDDHRLFNGAPDIACASDGHFVIAWHRDYTDVYARRFDPYGFPMGENIIVHPPADNAQIFPAVAMHDDHSFMVVWEDRRSGTSRIWGRLFNPDAQPLTDPFEISTHENAEEQCHDPAIAAGKNGEYLVLWSNESRQQLFAAHIDSLGNRIGELLLMSDDTFTAAFSPSVAAHPDYDIFTYAWGGVRSGLWQAYTDTYAPGAAGFLSPELLSPAIEQPHRVDVAMARLFNTVYVWDDESSGDADIYADWHGQKTPLRTTAGSDFDGLVPISWDPPYGSTENLVYHIHRIDPDGTHSVIATVDPSTRALPNLMLDYVDHTVTNGQTYRYGVQVEGERDDLIEFVESTPNASEEQSLRCTWSQVTPTIDGTITQEEWFDAAFFENIANPDAQAPVFLFIKNDSSSLYIAIADGNDHIVDNGNQMGILFDENNDDQWESSFSLGEGMLSLTKAGTAFIPYVGNYPNDLTFLAPREASNVEFAMSANEFSASYEARISLTDSPLQATPGGTIGFGLWIEDPGYFCAHGNGNTGEWPLDALWDAARTLGDLVLAAEPGTDKINLGLRYVESLDACDFNGDGDDELVVLTNEDGAGYSGILTIFDWNGYRFSPLWSSDRLEGYPYAVKVVDLDVDGLQDVLVSCDGLYFYKRSGDGWAPPVKLIDWDIINPSVCTDLNNDGLPDIAAGSPYADGGRARIYQQLPDHTFALVDSLEGVSGSNKLYALDINNDDMPDLVAAEFYSGMVFVYQNNGDFQFDQVFSEDSGERASNIAAADFDADGYGEFAVASLREAIQIYHNQRNGSFEVKYTGDSDIGYCTGLLAVNIDKDAFPDLIGAPFDGNLFFYHNTGAFDFDEIDAGLPRQDSYAAVYGDFDGNRLIDIAFGKDPVEILFDAALRFGVSTQVFEEKDTAPSEFRLHQNYPNPFNPLTTIEFDVARPVQVKLQIFDMLGREVATLIDDRYVPGHYTTTFDASRLASGIYFYRIRMGDFQQTRKMMLMR